MGKSFFDMLSFQVKSKNIPLLNLPFKYVKHKGEIRASLRNDTLGSRDDYC